MAQRKWIERECTNVSPFDELGLRQKMLQRVHGIQKKHLVTYATCPYGEVIAVYDEGVREEDVPWALWGRILRLFSKQGPFRIYLLASQSRRVFPENNAPITPQNINGGYTYPCQSESIVIYRAEDATRVLIHELQHACCLDDKQKGVDEVEAETEAWAELFYTALLSRGQPSLWKRRWRRQWEWMVGQNERIRRHMRSPLSREFPWRYTIGKEEVWRRWFESLPMVSPVFSVSPILVDSLRLTPPPTASDVRMYGVRPSSTIL
jgi:hypothetical protein